MYTPIFEKDGHNFVVPYTSFRDESDSEAYKIGVGASMVEGIMLGFKYTGKNLLVVDGINVLPYDLGNWTVYVLEN